MNGPALSTLVIAVFLSVTVVRGDSRLDLHDARVLVEHTPTFFQAVQRGECPQTSDSAVTGDTATVILRGGCKRFDWIADFGVDLTTGIVTQEVPPTSGKIETRQLAEMRERLFTLRSQAQISPSAALCLLAQIPQLNRSCERTKVDREGDSFITAVIQDSCGERRNDIHVIVDRYSAGVRNQRTGQEYKSSNFDAVREALLNIHSPVKLTEGQAKQFLASKPLIAEVARRDLLKDESCILYTRDPYNNADEVWFQVQSGCTDLKRTVRISVNVLNGEIKTIGPNETIASPQVEIARKSAFEEAQSRKQKSAEVLKATCPNN